MKRRTRPLIAIALLLALGLTTSLAIAWARVIFDHPHNQNNLPFVTSGQETKTQLNGWSIEIEPSTALTEIRTKHAPPAYSATPKEQRRIPAWSIARRTNASTGEAFDGLLIAHRGFVTIERSAGWPLRCLRLRTGTFRDDRLVPANHFLRGGILVSALPVPDPSAINTNPVDPAYTELPLTPIPLALAANTLVFSAAWLAILSPLPLLRARKFRRRRKADRCRTCDHDVSETPARCPQCGTPTDQRPPAIRRRTLALAAALTATAAASTLATAAWRHAKIPSIPPAHYAAATGDTDTLQRIIDRGQPIEDMLPTTRPSRFSTNSTPLETAVDAYQIETTELLLDAGADPNLRAASRPSYLTRLPLAWAILYLRYDLAHALLDHGADATIDFHVSFVWLATFSAFDKGKTSALTKDEQALLRKMLDRAKPHALSDPVSRVAALRRINETRTPMTEILIDDGFLDAVTPELIAWLLSSAAFFEQNALLDKLLDEKAAVNQSPRSIPALPLEHTTRHRKPTPLMTALMSNNTHAVRALLDAGADPTLKSTIRGYLGFPLGTRELTPIEFARESRDPDSRLRSYEDVPLEPVTDTILQLLTDAAEKQPTTDNPPPDN